MFFKLFLKIIKISHKTVLWKSVFLNILWELWDVTLQWKHQGWLLYWEKPMKSYWSASLTGPSGGISCRCASVPATTLLPRSSTAAPGIVFFMLNTAWTRCQSLRKMELWSPGTSFLRHVVLWQDAGVMVNLRNISHVALHEKEKRIKWIVFLGFNLGGA